MYVNFKEWKKCVNKYYINHDKKRSYIFFHFLPLPSTNQKEWNKIQLIQKEKPILAALQELSVNIWENTLYNYQCFFNPFYYSLCYTNHGQKQIGFCICWTILHWFATDPIKIPNQFVMPNVDPSLVFLFQWQDFFSYLL
jgi:hypothetical protein